MIARKLEKIIGKKLAIKISKSYQLGYIVSIDKAKTFNEKLSKNYMLEGNGDFFYLADKLEVKKYVAKVIGNEHNVDCIKSSRKPIKKFGDLPTGFVIKSNHASGQTKIVRNKNNIKKERLVNLQRQWLNTTYGYNKFEDWYSEIEPKIIIEKLLTYKYNDIEEPIEFKMFCFDGDIKLLYVNINKNSNRQRNFYDENFDLVNVDIKKSYPKNDTFDICNHLEAIQLAEKLSQDIPFVRVDMYYANPGCYKVGELTFSPGAGTDRFYPPSIDRELGYFWE